MSPARFRWGMLLVLIGGLILLANMDVLRGGWWQDIVIYFPIILIAIGIEKIFTNSRLEMLSYATTLAFVGAFAYLAFVGTSEGKYFEEETYSVTVDDDIASLFAEMRIEEGAVEIRDATNKLVFAEFPPYSRKPEVEYDRAGDEARVVFQGAGSRHLFGGAVKVETDEPDYWRVSFNDDIPLSLSCFGDRSDLHLNFTTMPLRDLKVDARDADIYVKVGDMLPLVTLSLAGRDSKLLLRVPRDAGLQLAGGSDSSFYNRLGLESRNGYFVNQGYDTLQKKIEVDLDEQFQSLSIDFY